MSSEGRMKRWLENRRQNRWLQNQNLKDSNKRSNRKAKRPKTRSQQSLLRKHDHLRSSCWKRRRKRRERRRRRKRKRHGKPKRVKRGKKRKIRSNKMKNRIARRRKRSSQNIRRYNWRLQKRWLQSPRPQYRRQTQNPKRMKQRNQWKTNRSERMTKMPKRK